MHVDDPDTFVGKGGYHFEEENVLSIMVLILAAKTHRRIVIRCHLIVASHAGSAAVGRGTGAHYFGPL